jgi:hypothetical protein
MIDIARIYAEAYFAESARPPGEEGNKMDWAISQIGSDNGRSWMKWLETAPAYVKEAIAAGLSAQREEALKETLIQRGTYKKSADEIYTMAADAYRTAMAAYQARTPGGKNGHKGAMRAAREIMPSFNPKTARTQAGHWEAVL